MIKKVCVCVCLFRIPERRCCAQKGRYSYLISQKMAANFVPTQPTAAAVDTSKKNDEDEAVGSQSWRRNVEGPFRRLDRNPGHLELARLALCAVTIVPLRVLLIAIMVPSYYIIARSWLALAPDRPWAHAVGMYVLRIACRLLLLLMGYWKIEVLGRENVGEGDEPRVFVSNHISYIEILFFLAELGPSFVMKRTCIQVPIAGSIAKRVLDSVSVDNKGGKEGGSGSQAIAARLERMFGKKTLEDWQNNVTRCSSAESGSESAHARRNNFPPGGAKAESWARGWRGNPLLLFPEGTTSNGSCLLRFKTGVFAGGMPVYPIAISYKYTRFSPAFESILVSVHTFRMLAEPANHLSVKFLPRYCPTAEQRIDRVAYAKAVQGVFCEATGLPPADSGYAEKAKYHKYLRQSYQEHPWGKAAFLLPAPDRHRGVTSVQWGNDNVFDPGSGIKDDAESESGAAGTGHMSRHGHNGYGVSADRGSCHGHVGGLGADADGRGLLRRRKPEK